MDIPVPVPNTEVKHPRADDTPIRGESREPPAFFILNILPVILPFGGKYE